MDGCKYTSEIIILPLKTRITEVNVFLEINILLLKRLLKRWMAARSPVKTNAVSFKEWMTATLSVAKIDILLQRKEAVIRVMK